MNAINASVGLMVLLFILLFVVVLSRWIFRINAIHQRLEEIGVLLAEAIKAIRGEKT